MSLLKQFIDKENKENQKYYDKLKQAYTNHIDNSGHGIDHITDVIVHIRQATQQLREVGIKSVDENVAIACAAYHDVGNFIGRDYHEMNSHGILKGELTIQDIVMNSQKMQKKYDMEDRKKLYQYIEDLHNGKPLNQFTEQEQKEMTNIFARKCEFEMVYNGINNGNGQQRSVDIHNKQETIAFITSITNNKELAENIYEELISVSNQKNNIFDKNLEYNPDLKKVTEEFKRNFSNEKDRKIIEQAVIDHRKDFEMTKDGKIPYHAQSIYGALVYDADKETESFAELTRCFNYGKAHGEQDRIKNCCNAISEFLYRHRTNNLELNKKILSDAKATFIRSIEIEEEKMNFDESDADKAKFNSQKEYIEKTLAIQTDENGNLFIPHGKNDKTILSEQGIDTRLQLPEYVDKMNPEKTKELVSKLLKNKEHMRDVSMGKLLNVFIGMGMFKKNFIKEQQAFQEAATASITEFYNKQKQIDFNNEIEMGIDNLFSPLDYGVIKPICTIGISSLTPDGIPNCQHDSPPYVEIPNGKFVELHSFDGGPSEKVPDTTAVQVCIINDFTLKHKKYMQEAQEKNLPIIEVVDGKVVCHTSEKDVSIDEFINSFKTETNINQSKDNKTQGIDVLNRDDDAR